MYTQRLAGQGAGGAYDQDENHELIARHDRPVLEARPGKEDPDGFTDLRAHRSSDGQPAGA